MNGISFAEFESSSFDNLYSNGFANAKHLDEVGKQLERVKPGDWASKALSEVTVPRIQPVPAQIEQARVVRPAKEPARQNGPSRALSFFLCTVKTHWLDGKHVVFGSVTDGMDVVKKIEAVGSQTGKTSKPVVIADCGQL
eukprot:s3472_g13.t1